MPITVSWEVNPGALLAICGAALAVIKLRLDTGAKADTSVSAARKAEAKADAAHEKITIVQSALSAYRQIQASGSSSVRCCGRSRTG